MRTPNKAYYVRELKKAKHARDAYHAQYLALRDAVHALYYAAYWHPDRNVDEAALWTAVRDAAFIPSGQTKVLLGDDRTQRYEAVGRIYRDPTNGVASVHMPPEYLNEFPLGETPVFRALDCTT